MELAAQITLFFRAERLPDKDTLSKSDPYLVLRDAAAPGSELGRTETLKNCLSPQWKRGISVRFFFETRQDMLVDIFDDDGNQRDDANDRLLHLQFQVAQVMGSRGHTLKLTSGATSVHISAVENAANASDLVTFSLSAAALKNMDTLSKSDPFVVLSRVLPSGSCKELFKSKTIDDNLDPNWPEQLQFSLGELCGANPDEKTLLLEVWDEDVSSHDLIGAARVSIAELSRSLEHHSAATGMQAQAIPLAPTTETAMSGNWYAHPHGHIRVRRWEVLHRPTFIEFLRGGLQLNLAVSVDFTASNGDPSQPDSLHFWSPHAPNQYAAAIAAVGDVVMQYDRDRSVPALGFGGQLPSGSTSHFFHLNLQENPYVQDVAGVLEAYRFALSQVRLSGPTNFSPTITNVARGAMAAANVYTVLLILTDGEITDMQETVDAIVEAERAPLSIIIVGVGKHSFGMMDQLDADKEPLRHTNGEVCRRDLVQFVPFRNFARRPVELAAEVLREIPSQVEKWAALVNYKVPA